MLRLVALLCLTAAVLGSPLQDSSLLGGRVVGGENAPIRDHPHQLSVYVGGRHECSAIIIAPLWALTAAQCVLDVAIPSMHIHGGSNKVGSGGTNYTVHQKIVHLSYNPMTSEHDIALLKINEIFEFDNFHERVALPRQGDPVPDVPLEVTGWGNTLAGGFGSNVLQVAQVDLVPAEVCIAAYAPTLVGQGMVCAASEGKDACQGDSGGPLIVQGTTIPKLLVGIVSWGRGCALSEYPGVYTQVSMYRDWILDNCGV